MKIMFVWRKMDKVAGGVERMLTTIMNNMVSRGYDVSLLTWDNKTASSYYHMDKAVKWHCLDMGDPMAKASWGLRLKRIPKFRKMVKRDKPDVIICFESGVFLTTRLFLTGYKVPIIAAERNAPSRLDFLPKKQKNNIIRSLKMADRIVVQFERYINEYPKFLHSKMTYIHNPVKVADKQASPGGVNSDDRILLCVARLAYQKNVDSLIKAFALLADDFPHWTLQIAGDGDDQKRLEELIEDLGLDSRVCLFGKVKDVDLLYRKAHLFCLPSRWEGFPNAIAEAMAHGLPSVGYDQCSGVSDLIEDGVTGKLADGLDNPDSLSQTLSVLMRDDIRRAEMGAAANKKIQQYEPEIVFDQWEKLLKEAIS